LKLFIVCFDTCYSTCGLLEAPPYVSDEGVASFACYIVDIPSYAFELLFLGVKRICIASSFDRAVGCYDVFVV